MLSGPLKTQLRNRSKVHMNRLKSRDVHVSHIIRCTNPASLDCEVPSTQHKQNPTALQTIMLSNCSLPRQLRRASIHQVAVSARHPHPFSFREGGNPQKHKLTTEKVGNVVLKRWSSSKSFKSRSNLNRGSRCQLLRCEGSMSSTRFSSSGHLGSATIARAADSCTLIISGRSRKELRMRASASLTSAKNA